MEDVGSGDGIRWRWAQQRRRLLARSTRAEGTCGGAPSARGGGWPRAPWLGAVRGRLPRVVYSDDMWSLLCCTVWTVLYCTVLFCIGLYCTVV